jgi:hypothetical protein
MSDRKSITINSASLLGGISGGGKRGTKRAKGSSSTSRRLRPSSIVQPSTLKKTLLERIKQHQRLREQGRDTDNERADGSSSERKDTNTASASATDASSSSSSFSQSMDFLRKLALKKRQNATQRRPSSHVPSIDVETARTPEAKMLNQVADTLHNGEIITNTGLIGLPVINTDVSSILKPASSNMFPDYYSSVPAVTVPVLSSYPMMTGMPMPGISELPFGMAQTPAPPNITELADLYNSTVAAAVSTPDNSNTNTDTTGKTADDLPIHVPEDPESFLPSIFIKDAPPHGCLKNGTKPTFREWANKMLHKPVETIKNMFGGGEGGHDGGDETQGTAASASSSGEMDGGGARGSAGKTLTKQHEHPENIAGMRVKIRKTQKKKYRIGKHDDVVGVLLKNKESQRHIQKQHLALKQKTIGEIRKYLYDHHLLKIGSNAPPDVLRRMYEDSILTGEVKNTNNGVLLHNFLSGDS